MTADRVTLAEVLMGHGEGNGWQLDETDHLVYDCECGTTSPPLALVEGCLDAAAVNAAARWHADHVAQVIRDHLTALAGDAGVREVVVRALEDETGRQMLAAWKGEIPAESVEFDFPADAAAAVAAFLGCVE